MKQHGSQTCYEIRVVGATPSDDNLIGLNTFNNRSEIVAPTTLYEIAYSINEHLIYLDMIFIHFLETHRIHP